jgi:hypothetical protein
MQLDCRMSLRMSSAANPTCVCTACIRNGYSVMSKARDVLSNGSGVME